MHNDIFCWMTQNLSDLKFTPEKQVSDICLDQDTGRFICYFGGSLMISFLDLSDEEIESLYPKANSPLSFKGRQVLKTTIMTHVLNCPACIELELMNEAEDCMIEKAICTNGSIFHLASNA